MTQVRSELSGARRYTVQRWVLGFSGSCSFSASGMRWATVPTTTGMTISRFRTRRTERYKGPSQA